MAKTHEDPDRAVLTVDVVIPDSRGRVLLIRRGHAPYAGTWCLPGGKVDPGETVEQAGIREVQEEIGLTVRIERVLGVLSDPQRDPRGQYVSIVLLAHSTDAAPSTTEEATAIERFSAPPPAVGFDHARVLEHFLGGKAAVPFLR